MTPQSSSTAARGFSVALVVAMARNRVIGSNGAMPWQMPGDLKAFRRLTMGCPVIMGRKTYQAIGRALDGRTNIVITRNRAIAAEGIVTTTSLDDALVAAAQALPPENGSQAGDRRVMVVGGGEIYRQALPLADIIYLTEIAADPDGDTWFPVLDPAVWRETSRVPITSDPRDAHTAERVTFERIPGP